MTATALKLLAVSIALSFLQMGCYNVHQITTDELAMLQSGHVAATVDLQTADGAVTVRGTTPVTVRTTDGETHSISAFNFVLNDQQLVAPDYDLLLARSSVESAQVYEFNKGQTYAVIGGSVLAAIGSFVAITILAGSDREFGQ